MFHTGVPAPVPSVSTRHTPGTSLLPIRPGACTSCLHAGPLPMGRHAPCRLGDHEPPWCQAMPDGDGASCHPAGTGAAVGIAMENHRYIASPTKRRDQGLPLVTCHGFAPPTFLHQGLALRASVPAITEAIRPGGAGPLSWSCGWHDRRTRQGEPERSSMMTCGPSHPSVSHQAPYSASQERTPGLCLRSPLRFPRASDLAGMSDGAPARLAEPQAYRSGWKGRAAGSDPGIKATPSSFLI